MGKLERRFQKHFSKKSKHKHDGWVTVQLLIDRAERAKQGGFAKQKWIIFCELLLPMFRLRLYEAKSTHSKYIEVHGHGKPMFKVRFSNHKPAKSRELEGDCDFIVGVAHTTITTTEDAIAAVEKHFGVKVHLGDFRFEKKENGQ